VAVLDETDEAFSDEDDKEQQVADSRHVTLLSSRWLADFVERNASAAKRCAAASSPLAWAS